MRMVRYYMLGFILIVLGLFLFQQSILLEQGFRKGNDIKIDTVARVSIFSDGETFNLVSAERLPANLLSQANISLFPGDQIWFEGKAIPPDQELPFDQSYALHVQRRWPVKIVYGSQVFTVKSTASTLGGALSDAGISLYSKDKLSLPFETSLEGPLEVKIQPSRRLTIQTAEGPIEVRSAAATVGAALAEVGLPLQGMDYSLPSADSPLPPHGEIRLVRVKENVLLETSPIPFDTQSQPSQELELDNQQVVQSGEIGLTARRVRIRLEDGIEVSRQLEGEYMAKEPKPRIIGYGTKVVPHTENTPDGKIKYWRALNMYAVSYNPTSNQGTGTATGIPLAKGVAAVDINYIPFGTRLYIPGYGQAIAADVGGGVKGRMIDLGYSDDDYVSWHQWVTVYFLWPPPENIMWIIP